MDWLQCKDQRVDGSSNAKTIMDPGFILALQSLGRLDGISGRLDEAQYWQALASRLPFFVFV